MPVDAAPGAATGKGGDQRARALCLIQTLYPSHCEADRQGKASIAARSVTLTIGATSRAERVNSPLIGLLRGASGIIGGRVQSGGRVRERD